MITPDGQSVQAAYFVAITPPQRPYTPRTYTLRHAAGDIEFTFTVRKPRVALVPTYTPLMAWPARADQIEQTSLVVRAAHARYCEKNPQKALALYNEAVERRARFRSDAPAWYQVLPRAELLTELGRPAEARALLKPCFDKAIRTNVYNVAQIRAALDRAEQAAAAR